MNRICAVCGSRFFHVAMRGPSPRFCSVRCRVRAHRARQKEASDQVTIPPCMRNRKRWVRHDARKRPLTVHGWYASVNRPSDWDTYQRATDSEVGVGAGFVLGDGIGCYDLDDAIGADGVPHPWAQRYLKRWREDAILIERSRSGRGIHIFVRMEEGPGRKIRKNAVKVEVYSRARYIAITGDRI